MNNGANIIYLGSDELHQQPGAVNLTNDANLTERSVTFCIQKNKKADALSVLVPGFAAPGFPNLVLQNPPKDRTDATHCYFDCVFYGVLSASEGGRDDAYEYFDKPGKNIVALTVGTINCQYVQPVYRFSYTVPADSPDRHDDREIALPSSVSASNTDDGSSVTLPPESFFWQFYELEELNYGAYNQVREYWKLSYKYGSS